MLLIMFILPIIFVVLAFILWYRAGRDEKVADTVEFYPPGGFNSAEIGFLYRGETNKIDVVSLLIYLANKGYISISEIEGRSFHSVKKGFMITKLKEYDGYNANERLFLAGLFRRGSEITCAKLNNSFYTTLDEITANLDNEATKDQILKRNSLINNFPVTIPVIIMIIATFFLITAKPMKEYGDTIMMATPLSYPESLMPALLFPAMGFVIIFSQMTGLFSRLTNPRAGKFVSFPIILIGAVLGGVPWAFTVLPAFLDKPVYFAAYAAGLICVFLMIAVIKNLQERTAYGNEMLGKIRGFKNFLKSPEKSKLEALVTENPAYFYEVLPYAYVLGVSDKLIGKFNSIAIQAPDWYAGSGSFSAASFGSFMNSAMASACRAMSSRPSSGGSSGGGS